jgi:hypothetical protein
MGNPTVLTTASKLPAAMASMAIIDWSAISISVAFFRRKPQRQWNMT